MAPPKKVRAAVDSLLSWMTNTERSHNEGVLRLIASFPGAEELEDMGYKPSIPMMGWREFQEIQGVMDVIEGKSDVEYLVERILHEGDEDMDED
jgi:hypothetical protein